MSKKIILSADSTCDIGDELKKKFDVQFFYSPILLGEESYVDCVSITPDEIYAGWRERGVLPRTAAIPLEDYIESFSKWTAQGCDVIHFSLGSGISAAHQNSVIAAQEVGNGRVFSIDSCSLSTGIALLVVKAGEMIAAGMDAESIAAKIKEMVPKTNASFVLDTLEFMRAGGRCSAVEMFGANLLKLKPSIEVNNRDEGKMGVGKKYRGAYEKVLAEYVADRLKDRDDLDLDRIFITHSGVKPGDVELVEQEIKKYAEFKELYVTRASCTISSHCGPRTLGILFMTK